MIVRDPPSSLKLFFVMQGSVVPAILGKITGIALLSLLVLVIDRHVITLPHISIAAMGIFGVALSLFLGFRNNAAYDRWWEARKLWGGMIADVRNLCRQSTLFIRDSNARTDILNHTVAFAHLHRGFLRDTIVEAEIAPLVGAEQAKHLQSFANSADAALRTITERLATLSDQDQLDGFGRMTLSNTLSSLALAQAGCERIRSTPLPFVYSLLVRRTTYLYCGLLPFALIDSAGWFAPVFAAVVAYVFFGLQAVTNELERPFHNLQNGLPLDAMCRIIETSVAESLGRPAPEPLPVVNHVLS
ncbi:bestrophin family protein [Neptunicoccus sediminis]|uniref:bestrophin family protein n=1 Tax=Neptunicoccus sediminis TaxID=1892596 RepID=UPI00084604A2|nr:bestrophin family ion channel [Neptunicoccus sediminis]